MRFPVTNALNNTMTGGVREPFVCRCGCSGPDIVVIVGENVAQSIVKEPCPMVSTSTGSHMYVSAILTSPTSSGNVDSGTFTGSRCSL